VSRDRGLVRRLVRRGFMGGYAKLHRVGVKQVTSKGVGLHTDDGGLCLKCRRARVVALNRSWVFRFEDGTGEHKVGLGSVATVSLAKARERAAAMRQERLDGTNPLARMGRSGRTSRRSSRLRQSAEARAKVPSAV
jgi:Arm DNA-binding domain